MLRLVEPELLDTLPPQHRLAKGSRADIRRVNRLMGNAGILAHAFQNHLPRACLHTQPLRVADLGSGEGLVMLDVARRSSAVSAEVQLTLVDRHNVVSEETLREFAKLGWRAELAETDVLNWLEKSAPRVDFIFVNLLLHQFVEKELKVLLNRAAARTSVFIACEPRRTPLALAASRCLWLAGCNAVSRHDGPTSVRAGFAGNELSALWPADFAWHRSEKPVGLFNHCFIAERND